MLDNILELIELRSFSNLWFWIMLAVLWSSTSHRVLGVPWDMVTRVRRNPDAQMTKDLDAMIRINARRINQIAHESGLLLVAFWSFLMTSLVILGFIYKNEFAQAVFLLGFPMSLVALVSVSTARTILHDHLHGEAVYRRMHRHRVITQVIGMVSIFITAMWGMLQNITGGFLY